MNREELISLANLYLSLDENISTRSEIQDLLDKKEYNELSLLLHPLSFGTAGLRAKMGAGFSQMNELTVTLATHGVLSYILTTNSKPILVVGYDHRHNSHAFALATASVFHNYEVYLFNTIIHTPLVPYAVTKYGASAGVMITASHNPKDDNGYKLYWNNGCQIISPVDKEIQKRIKNAQVPREKCKPLIANVEEEYFCDIQRLLRKPRPTSIKFTYTPVHGVGLKYAERVFKMLGVWENVYVVEEQSKPDPDFPTVKYPNPEEKEVFELSHQLAEKNDAVISFANDPDADRLGVAERGRIFSGNEIGAIIASYMWNKSDKKNIAMITTVVSSQLLKKMGEKEGFLVEETLTGFKWIGNKAIELRANSYQVLFGYEEAIGYMCGDIVNDKDGISALGVITEIAIDCYEKKSSLAGYLEEIYRKYGYFYCRNGYYKVDSVDVVEEVFQELKVYPNSIGNEFEVVNIRDLTAGYDSSRSDKKATLPATQMVTYYAKDDENEYCISLRKSGTEPKIKYYAEISGDYEKKKELENRLDEFVKVFTKSVLKPEKFGLK